MNPLPEIVRTRFETEPEQPHFALPEAQDDIDRAIQMLRVAGQYRAQEGQLEIQFLAAVGERSKVLWQAGAAEGEAGLEVRR